MEARAPDPPGPEVKGRKIPSRRRICFVRGKLGMGYISSISAHEKTYRTYTLIQQFVPLGCTHPHTQELGFC
jgi:hypothetical protein